jgi:hypothetical protein
MFVLKIVSVCRKVFGKRCFNIGNFDAVNFIAQTIEVGIQRDFAKMNIKIEFHK